MLCAILDSNNVVTGVVALDAGVAPPPGWAPVPGGVAVEPGWTTPDNGATWHEGSAPPAPAAPTPDQVASAVQTLQAALDPSAPTPALADQVNALAVIVASNVGLGS